MTARRSRVLLLATGLAIGGLAACSSAPPVVTGATGASASARAAGARSSDIADEWLTTEEAIREEIAEELGDSGLDATAIAILVDGTSVALRGSVRSADERELARRAALDAEGVSDVDASGLVVR